MTYKNYDSLEVQQKVNEIDNKCEKDYVDDEVAKIDSKIDEKVSGLSSSLEEKASYQEVNEAIATAQLEGASVDTSAFTKTSQLTNALMEGKLDLPLTFERGTIAGTGTLYDSTTDWRSNSFKLGNNTEITIVLPTGVNLVTWRYSDLSSDALQAESITTSGKYTIRGGFYYYFVLKHSTSGTEVTQTMLNSCKFYYYPIFDYINRINNVQSQIDEINNSYATPYTTQEDAIINSVYKVINSSTIVFGLITDNHCGITHWDNLYNHGKVLNSLAERVGCDFCINLGDVFVDTSDHGENLDRLYKYWSNNNYTTVPNLYCMGNHEVFAQSDGTTALEEWQVVSQVNRTNKHIQKGNGSYYYFDIRSCRFIVLNSSSNTNCGFSDEQEAFLNECFSTIGYRKAIIFTHIPLDSSLMLQSTPKNADKIRAILVANKDKVIAVLHGHTHWDNNARLDDIEQISFCCAMSGKVDTSTFTGIGTPLSYDRAYGTYTEYCMDIVCVDTYKDIVRTFRFGAGSNRVIDCAKSTT